MSLSVADREFAKLLDRFGPQASGRAVSTAAAEDHCRSLAGGHDENFSVLSFALPKALRQDFANVYAFCRWADDLGDEVAGTEDSLRLLDWWQSELDACYRGEAWHPVFVALAKTIRRHRLPKEPFDDLISAFRQDQTKTAYESFEELRDYCRRSADPVGRIVLRLCDRYDEENVALSDSVCTGLQLINFWQDVARDFAIGRVYLSREDRMRFGYADDDLTARRTTPAFVELMKFEVDRAREMLTAGLPLADRMPGRLKIVIAMFAMGGLRICDRIEAIGYRVWETRPKLTKFDTGRLAVCASGRAIASSWRGRR
ncbi:MAG: squalene synthase HpnC [Planctomycetaceae bacterium]|nr:squalene synthase HpnC [Planctomycetaceae bacterium]